MYFLVVYTFLSFLFIGRTSQIYVVQTLAVYSMLANDSALFGFPATFLIQYSK